MSLAMASLDSESYMDTDLQKIAVSGTILAYILQEFGSCPGDTDGVLFGRLETTTSSTLEDDDEQSGFREERTAIVTGFYCSGRLFSFYDATGLVDLTKLAKVVGDRGNRGGDPPIGWFVGRRNSLMRPSMRETAVTRSLRLAASTTARHLEYAGLSRASVSSGSARNLKESRMTPKTDGGEATNPADCSPKGTRSSSQSSSASRNESRSIPKNLGGTPGGVSSPIEVDSSVSDVSTKPKREIFRDGLHSSSNVVRSGGMSSPLEVDTAGSDSSSKSKSKGPQASKGRQPAVGVSSSSDVLALAVTNSIGVPPSSPCLFLLLTEFGTQQAVHTHDYRAYQYHFNSRMFQPRAIRIINIGPAFRVQYDSFSPVVPFPLLSSGVEGDDESPSWSTSTVLRTKRRELHEDGRKAHIALPKEQALLDMYSEGYNVERLSSLVGPDGMRQVPELESLYAKMLSKLETLAKQVAESSHALTEQEKLNAQMRLGFTGLE